MAYAQLISAVISFVVIFLVGGIAAHLSNWEELNLWILLLLVFPFVYLIAGYFLLKAKRWAWYMSLVLQIMGLVDVQIGDSFSWVWQPGLEFNISFYSSGTGGAIDILAIIFIFLLIRGRAMLQGETSEELSQ